MTVQFSSDIHDEDIEISLHEKSGIFGKKKIVPVDEWEDVLPKNLHPILAVINNLVEEFNGTCSANKILLSHESVVGLAESQAHVLGLPSSIPFAFDIRTNGMVDEPTFFISTSWTNSGGVREMGIVRKGAFIHKQGIHSYRIPSPVYEIVKATEVLSSGHVLDEDNRYRALCELHELLPKTDGEHNVPVKSDLYFNSVRILHASSFSLQIPTDGNSFEFNPILFTRKAVGRAEESGRCLDEAENLLSPKLQDIFSRGRFRKWSKARNCYAIDGGIFVYIDPDLKKALDVVRRIQQASSEERKKFISSPYRIIKENLENNIASEAIEHLFVETEQYAANVIGLGLWAPPVIPWIIKQPNSWLPEKFGIKIADKFVQINPGDVEKFREEVSKRIFTLDVKDFDQEPFICDGEEVFFPKTREGLEETLSALEKLSGIVKPDIKSEDRDPITGNQEDIIKNKLHQFLLIEDNISDVRYHLKPVKRSSSQLYDYPVALKSTLKAHQEKGLKWLIDSWTSGIPGVLLADDMGLGKTLQALTFLAWIKERKNSGEKSCSEPVLIIAPTGLLSNWQREIQTHLREPFLGEICKAYGKNLSAVKILNQNDISTGQTNIDRDQLRKFDVVLTTYETYRDYHHSFGGIRFSVAVLDECQKIKNPKSQVNRAVASMNAEFVIAMTGTPVENAMEDLWAILDRAWPGFLGSLKLFSSRYSSNDQEVLVELTKRLKEPSTNEVSSPIMYRRMKEDILNDLPRKILHPMKLEMPTEQANAYLEVVNRAKEQSPPPMLVTLHKLRGISLHPIHPENAISEGNFASYDNYIASSARLKKTIEILDTIQSKNEKVLIFIENLSMQSLVAEIIKKRYSLKKRPDIINGKTGSDRIQRFVDEFQDNSDFDVMILSPKVGGVGLTLTAANHVIHLSRWWNPAVEDQSTDRVYRIGQKKDVHVYYPMAVHPETHIRENSFDLKLNSLLERKRKLSRDMLIPTESPSDTENLYRETVGFSNKPSIITNEELDRMGDRAFEDWVLGSARQSGYVADATPTSWDYGSDGILKHKETNQKFIIQCKHSNLPKIESDKVIEDLLRARSAYDSADNAILVALTNSYFSPSVIKKMVAHRIKYFDRDNIQYWPAL